MICDNCKIDREKSDFLNNQKFCYRCEYQIKLNKMPKNRKPKSNRCRMCKKEIAHIEELKKRQRTTFCSKECADKGLKQQRDDYWVRNIRCP